MLRLRVNTPLLWFDEKGETGNLDSFIFSMKLESLLYL